MTTHEGETTYFFDKAGNPVNSADKAHTIEVVGADGTHTILQRSQEEATEPKP